MPAAAAICDIVTDARPCSRASAAVVSRVASWTARRCSSIVSVHSFGTSQGYMVMIEGQSALTATLCLDKTGTVMSTRRPDRAPRRMTKGNAMLTAEADIRTEHAATYLARLCGHAGKMATAGRRPGHRQPGLGPVDHAGPPRPARGPRRGSRPGEPAADPGSAHRAPAEIRPARAPDRALAGPRRLRQAPPPVRNIFMPNGPGHPPRFRVKRREPDSPAPPARSARGQPPDQHYRQNRRPDHLRPIWTPRAAGLELLIDSHLNVY